MNNGSTRQTQRDQRGVRPMLRRAFGIAYLGLTIAALQPLSAEGITDARELREFAEYVDDESLVENTLESGPISLDPEMLGTTETYPSYEQDIESYAADRQKSPAVISIEEGMIGQDELDPDFEGSIADPMGAADFDVDQLIAANAQSMPRQPEARIADDETVFVISEIVPEYVWDREGNPDAGELLEAQVALQETPDGYIAAQDPERALRVSLADIGKLPDQRFGRSALQAMLEAMVGRFHEQGVVGVYIAPNFEDVTAEGQDLRPGSRRAMRVNVRVPVVGEMHTVAQGDAVDMEERIDNPVHQSILDNSPVSIGGFIIKDNVEDYIHWLNRHPGRQVHMALTPSNGENGEAKLDYVVSESKPWTAFFHVANTGTYNTCWWRETFGFRHNNLLGWDDIAILNYSTASFQDSHAVYAKWDAPMTFILDRLRSYNDFGYSHFRESDLGIFKTGIKGHTLQFGSEWYYNAWQQGVHFIDVFLGFQWQNINVKTNIGPVVTGEGREAISYINFGARYERFTDEGNTRAEVKIHSTLDWFNSIRQDRIDKLGRMGVDDSWVIYSGYLTHSQYIDSWWGAPERAHMLEAAIRGQTVFNDRLIPQQKMTLGGQNTIRGYSEAVTSGDKVYMGSLEYRFYIPRILEPESQPERSFLGKTFRWAPEYPGGRPDWDLALSAYTDLGYAHNIKKMSMEFDNFLWGIGIGVEFVFQKYFRIRGDWAWALHKVTTAGNVTSPGDSRGHVSAAFVY